MAVLAQLRQDFVLASLRVVIPYHAQPTQHTTLPNNTTTTTTIVIVSFFGDQYFWGDRVTDLGVGKTIRIQNLTMENLCEALVAVSTDPVMQSKAAAIGKKLQSEDGVKTAIEDFHHYLPIATPRAF